MKGCIRCLKALVHAFKPKWKNWWATWYGFQFLYASCSKTNVCHLVFLGNQCPFYSFLLLMFNTRYTITSLTTYLMKKPICTVWLLSYWFEPFMWLKSGSLLQIIRTWDPADRFASTLLDFSNRVCVKNYTTFQTYSRKSPINITYLT